MATTIITHEHISKSPDFEKSFPHMDITRFYRGLFFCKRTTTPDNYVGFCQAILSSDPDEIKTRCDVSPDGLNAVITAIDGICVRSCHECRFVPKKNY